jgi:EAL domain-containing protein (putative c-di-GMP-specific phosphodiesterase class I)
MSLALTDLIARAAAWNVGADAMSGAEARAALLGRRFAIRYSPILDTLSGETIGHQASALFAGARGSELPAGEVFAALHGQAPLLFHAEVEIKRLALAQAPAGGCLWVCVDPDSYAAAESPTGNALAELLSAPGVVVRAVENRAAANVRRARAMLRGLAAHRIAVALEAESPVDGWASPAALEADWVRIALAGGERLRTHPRLPQLERTLADAHCAGTRSLLSGVRDLGDLALAADLGITAVAGPLFGRAAFTRWAAQPQERSARAA